MEGLGYDDREISGLDTDTVVQRAAQFCQVKDQEKSEHQEGFTTGNGDRRWQREEEQREEEQRSTGNFIKKSFGWHCQSPYRA